MVNKYLVAERIKRIRNKHNLSLRKMAKIINLKKE